MKKFEIATVRSQRLRRIATGYALAMTIFFEAERFLSCHCESRLAR